MKIFTIIISVLAIVCFSVVNVIADTQVNYSVKTESSFYPQVKEDDAKAVAFFSSTSEAAETA